MMSTLQHTNRSSASLQGNDSDRVEMELITGLRHKDQKALSRLYKSYGPALKGIISRIIDNEELTEDLLQETFVKIWISFHKYQSSKGRLFTWMSTLARNVALDELRRKSYINNNKNIDIAEIQSDVAALKTNARDPDTIGLRGLVKLLNPVQHKVLNMVYFEGYTHTEVAEALRLPLGTVKSRIRSGLIAMKKFF